MSYLCVCNLYEYILVYQVLDFILNENVTVQLDNITVCCVDIWSDWYKIYKIYGDLWTSYGFVDGDGKLLKATAIFPRIWYIVYTICMCWMECQIVTAHKLM